MHGHTHPVGWLQSCASAQPWPSSLCIWCLVVLPCPLGTVLHLDSLDLLPPSYHPNRGVPQGHCLASLDEPSDFHVYHSHTQQSPSRPVSLAVTSSLTSNLFDTSHGSIPNLPSQLFFQLQSSTFLAASAPWLAVLSIFLTTFHIGHMSPATLSYCLPSLMLQHMLSVSLPQLSLARTIPWTPLIHSLLTFTLELSF